MAHVRKKANDLWGSTNRLAIVLSCVAFGGVNSGRQRVAESYRRAAEAFEAVADAWQARAE